MRGQRGFTIIETCISLLVLMVAGIGAAALFVHASQYNSGAVDRDGAGAVAQARIEQLRRLPFSDAGLNATAAGGVTTTVANAGRNYTVVTTITNTSPTLKTITVEVTPQAAGGDWAGTSVRLMTLRATTETGSYL
jgi:Tfp pilus assembly protein PilV